MTFSWDFNTATLLAIGIQIVLLVAFLVKIHGKANAAFDMAEKALERADEAHEKIILTNASISLLREHVAREYPDNEALGKMEKRIIEEVHRINERIDEFLDRRHTK